MFLKTEMTCFNRKPFKNSMQVKNGFDESGRQLFKTILVEMTKSCKLDVKLDHPGCNGCVWQKTTDHRDEKGGSALVLADGKKYRDTAGNEVKVGLTRTGDLFPFENCGNSLIRYTSDGRSVTEGASGADHFDLVEEIHQEAF